MRGGTHAEWLVLLYAAGAAVFFFAGIQWLGALFAFVAGVGLLALPFALAAQRADRKSREERISA